MKTKNKNRQALVRQLALGATEEEIKQFELIKNYHCRKSDSDTIRFLIHQENEKILSKTMPNGIENYAKCSVMECMKS